LRLFLTSSVGFPMYGELGCIGVASAALARALFTGVAGELAARVGVMVLC
jgi:hypothetical protein